MIVTFRGGKLVPLLRQAQPVRVWAWGGGSGGLEGADVAARRGLGEVQFATVAHCTRYLLAATVAHAAKAVEGAFYLAFGEASACGGVDGGGGGVKVVDQDDAHGSSVWQGGWFVPPW